MSKKAPPAGGAFWLDKTAKKYQNKGRKMPKKAKAFDQDLYKNRSINDLILFSIYSIISNEEKCPFERLIKECFALFPETFSFSKYPQWPDSRKIDRQLRTLRKRKLLIGNPQTSFSLTKLGKQIAIETAKTFRQRKLFK